MRCGPAPSARNFYSAGVLATNSPEAGSTAELECLQSPKKEQEWRGKIADGGAARETDVSSNRMLRMIKLG
ncbi:hypothetical protein TRIATDRAFT_260241 [Trichoderma atroviride IMI 206040]|uniref:Uncharacterized protein n=1 Tax=Hypocrea atroviridis (strain ATCC 20476 / IMI 206040) TaxID=452589 RepID=G9PCE9_HYPAI|nr:uncharacterized protein TRIATDRAFT_260241 [Trichoderma atroviride IMI 206040]EHK39523.1 hypothetical protein TRIATDRAFT_260241 [Trichoderma atroviride IMI 206040]